MQQSGKDTIMWQTLMTKQSKTIWLTNLIHQTLQKNNMMHSRLRGHYHIHCEPFLGVGFQAVIRIQCCCESCIEKIKSEWVEGKEPAEQPLLYRNVHWKYASFFSGDEGYTDWKIIETIDKPREKKLDALNLEVLSGIAERTRRRVLDNRYGEIMTDENETHGYYIVKWDRPPH